MVIRDFIKWLQNQDPDLSQSEIARRARLSQSVINKILVGTGTRDAAPETYQRLAAGFPARWQQFVEEREDVRCSLYERYAWAVGALPLPRGQFAPSGPRRRGVAA